MDHLGLTIKWSYPCQVDINNIDDYSLSSLSSKFDWTKVVETTRSVTFHSRHSLPVEKHIVVKNTHTAIISCEIFDAVQNLIRGRKKNYTKVKKHLFTNVLSCSDCGTGM